MTRSLAICLIANVLVLSCQSAPRPEPRQQNNPRSTEEDRKVTPPEGREQPLTPGGSTKPGDSEKTTVELEAEELSAFKARLIASAWKLCLSQDRSSTRVDIVFNSDATWTSTTSSFDAVNCKAKTVATTVDKGTYEILKSMGKAMFPMNLKQLTGKVGTTYELLGLRGDILFFGKFDDVYDGSKPEKRPVELNDYGYGSGSVLPIITL